jgi:hypothetical protein
VLFSSSGDQQEQPFAQVNGHRSILIKSQGLAASSTGCQTMLMSFWSRTGQIAWRFSQLDCVAATVKTGCVHEAPYYSSRTWLLVHGRPGPHVDQACSAWRLVEEGEGGRGEQRGDEDVVVVRA